MPGRRSAAAWILIAFAAAACGDSPSAVAEEPAAFPETPPPAARRVERDVPYVPTPHTVVRRMLEMAEVSSEDLVYDLGSGDGRIVIAAARDLGARGVGVDIDPERIREANENAERAGVADRVQFIQGDLFETDLRPATAVTLYLLHSVNLRLRPKLLEELRPGTPVVSHDFDMADWKPDATDRIDRSDIFLWIVPAEVGGTWTWTLEGLGPRSAKIRQRFQEIDGTSEGAPLREATLRGDRIAFSTFETIDGRTVAHRYQGTVDGGTIEGTVRTDGGTTRRWVARRAS